MAVISKQFQYFCQTLGIKAESQHLNQIEKNVSVFLFYHLPQVSSITLTHCNIVVRHRSSDAVPETRNSIILTLIPIIYLK